MGVIIMKRYKNISGGSGVQTYEIGDDFIRVTFIDGTPYIYSYKSAGRQHIEEMKDLAERGKGLATYISKHVKDLYE